MPEQPEIDDRHDTILVDGDDPDHVLPPQELDPFTPELSPPPRAKAALRVALLVIVALVAVAIVYAIAR